MCVVVSYLHKHENVNLFGLDQWEGAQRYLVFNWPTQIGRGLSTLRPKSSILRRHYLAGSARFNNDNASVIDLKNFDATILYFCIY